MSTRQARPAVRDPGGGNAQVPASRRRPAAADPAAAASQPHAGPWRRAFATALVLTILAIACWALLGSSLLVVRHVEVTGNRLVTAAQIRRAARINAGAPLATVSTAAAARRVERLAPVLSATVRRSWPDTIVIIVRERTPVFAVAAAGRYQLVDSHGVVVRWASRKPASMPLLSGPAVVRGNPAVSAAAAVLRQLTRGLRSRVVSVSAASASSVTLHLAGGITVLWGSAANPVQKLAELAMLLRTHARYYDISDPNSVVTAG